MAARDDNKVDGAKKKPASMLQLWFEEAWEAWLKPIGGLLLCALAYLLYKFDLVGESSAGPVAVLVVLGGTAFSTAVPSWPLVRTPLQRALFVTTCAAWLIATGYPSLRAATPSAPLAEGRLTAAQPTTTVKVRSNGPYEIAVGGQFKTAGGEAEASYTIKASGGGSDEVQGTIKRSLVRMRTSRRGGTSTQLQEHNENVHRLPHVSGGELTLTVDGVDEQLDNGLVVDVRPAGLNPIFFWGLGALALLLALGLDARLTEGKGKLKSYLAVGVGICYVFSIAYPDEATPHSLVRPAVSSLLLALIIGGLGGWLGGIIARALFGPKLKKARR
jgi:hypothetical protein